MPAEEVRAHVVPQGAPVGAVRAAKGLLPGVGPEVVLQVAGLAPDHLAAHRAPVLAGAQVTALDVQRAVASLSSIAGGVVVGVEVWFTVE